MVKKKNYYYTVLKFMIVIEIFYILHFKFITYSLLMLTTIFFQIK